MYCQRCGVEAPTKQVSFYQNIGALVIRFHKHTSGNLCKRCINQVFWEYTLIDLFLGWWGIISFFFNLFAIPNNIINYLGSLSLADTPAGAQPPTLTPDVIERIKPFHLKIIELVNGGAAIDQVAQQIAPQAGVMPGHITMYIHALIAASQKPQTVAR